jgi:hypothetical protein
MIEFQYITVLVLFLSLIIYNQTTLYSTIIFIGICVIGYTIYIKNISKQFSSNVQYIETRPKLLYTLLKLKNSPNKDIVEKCNYILYLIQNKKEHDYLSITHLLNELQILKEYLEEVHQSELTTTDKRYIYNCISSIILNLAELNNIKLSKEKKMNNMENFIYLKNTIGY